MTTPGGVPLAEVTLEALRAGRLDAAEIRATPETLRRQSEVARAAGRLPLAASLERAAELAAVPDELLLAVYTALRPRRATAAGARGLGRAPREPRRGGDRRFRARGSGRLRRARAARGWLAGGSRRASGATSTARCSSLRTRSSVSSQQTGPRDPVPELVVENGAVVRMDGRAAADFDVIDRFVVAHGLDLGVAAEAMAIDDVELARMLVALDVPRAELVRLARGLTPAKLARVVGLLDPVELMLALKKLRARRAPSNQAHVTNLKESPALLAADAAEAARRGLRRDRDDGRRRPLCAAERARAPRRLADRPAWSDDAVRGRGASQPRARDPRSRHVRRDALRLRHRAGVRGRRRHAVVEGVSRRCVRLARGEGALHLRDRLGGAHGLRAGPFDALSRGALPRGGARSRLAGSPERVDLVRRPRALRPGRHARDSRRERARGVARPRGRLRQRRDRVALRDPEDREAHGPVPPGNGLRDLRVLGDAAPRQHVRRRQLRCGRPRRMAHRPARLAGGRRDRAGRRRRGAARPRAGRAGDPGRVRGAGSAAGDGRRGRRRDDGLRLERDAGSRPRGRRRGRRRRCSRAACRGSTWRSRSPSAASATRPRRFSRCSASASRRTTSRPRRSSTPTASSTRRSTTRTNTRAREPATGSRERAGSSSRRCRTSSTRRFSRTRTRAESRSWSERGEARAGDDPARGRRRRRSRVRGHDPVDDRRSPSRDVLEAVCDGIRAGGATPRHRPGPTRRRRRVHRPRRRAARPDRGSRSASSRRARR